MHNLFQYVPGNSIIHRMNPITKIFLTIVICIAAFVSGNLLFLAGLLAVDLLIGFIAGIPEKTLTIFKGLLKIAIFLFVLQILLVRGGTPVFWIITDEGLLTAAKVVLRLVIVCIPLALVLAVTRISDLTNSLVQVLHVPYKYAFTLSTAIRFIPQFLEEMSGIMEAQTARGVAFDKAKGLKKFSMILPLCAPLLISSVRKTDLTAAAAEVRGFRLRTRQSGYKRYPFTLLDLGAAAFCLLLLAAAILL
ncbi:MAG: energy-coupling factor transporter transmembrane protein EcfT [Clostridiales bacterium]|nr:energy-coupling factor transporter transmembrane protein EcfT [Clostridiales bacterium]